jgi:hypothetical protein
MQGDSSDVSDTLRQTPAVLSRLAIQVGPVRFHFRSEAGKARPFVVPVSLSRHPLVADHFFYCIPEKLLELVVQCLGDERFDRQLLELERKLSALVGDYAVNVGIRREGPMSYELLAPCRPLTIRYDDLKNLGWGKTEVEIHEIERIGNERLQALSEPIRGYCGWLMINREFVEEQISCFAAILTKSAKMIFQGQFSGQVARHYQNRSRMNRGSLRSEISTADGGSNHLPVLNYHNHSRPWSRLSRPWQRIWPQRREAFPSFFPTSSRSRHVAFCSKPSGMRFTGSSHRDIFSNGSGSLVGRIRQRTPSIATVVCSACSIIGGFFMRGIRQP